MRKNLVCILSVASILTFACQREEVSPVFNPNKKAEGSYYTPNYTLAKTNNELAALHKDPKANLIRTLEQFDALLAAGDTPLARLSKVVQQEFRSNLVFRKNIGVVSLGFSCIISRLSYDEFSQVLALFGLDVKHGYWGLSQDATIRQQLGQEITTTTLSNISKTIEKDYPGYACTSKHNCSAQVDAICMSGCDNP